MTVRVVLLLSLIAFAITLAIVIGQRLSTEAMAVLLGVLAGMLASVPTSMLVVWVAVKQMRPAPPSPVAAPPQERVVYIPTPNYGVAAAPTYPNGMQPPMPNPMMAPLPPAIPSRQFTVIGGVDDLDDENGYYTPMEMQ